MENSAIDYSHIKGWGIDANPQNEPTYPIKHYTGDDHKRMGYKKPTQQKVEMEILHSNERPGVSAVFGTSSPPSGLSGIIRRWAFRYSESSYGHWLPLLVADRINVVEGIIGDLFKGRIPNFFAESGWKSEWKYNRKNVIKKTAIQFAIATALVAIIIGRKRLKKKMNL